MLLTVFCFAYTKADIERPLNPKEKAQIKIDRIFKSVVKHVTPFQKQDYIENLINNIQIAFPAEVKDYMFVVKTIAADTPNETVEKIITDASDCVNTIKNNKKFGFETLLKCIIIAIQINLSNVKKENT